MKVGASIIFIPVLIISFMTLGLSQNQEPQSEFLFAIVEIQQSSHNDQLDVEIKLANVIQQKLKLPTRSDKVSPSEFNTMSFQITDDQNTILDEVVLHNPLQETREYVNEHGALARVLVERTSRSILIRRPISQKATQLSVKQNSVTRSSNPVTLKFR